MPRKPDSPPRPYVTDPVRYAIDVPMVYRWDSRPPDVIRQVGFAGSPTLFFNKIFGQRTIFSAEDQSGADFYFIELQGGMSEYGGGGTNYFLYRINALGIPAVKIAPHADDFGFIKRFASRFPDMPKDPFLHEYGMPPPALMSRFGNYISQVARFNHEVQLCGPIPPHKIEFVEARNLKVSNSTWL